MTQSQVLPETTVVGTSPLVATTDRPELQTIELKLPSSDLTIDTFVSYSYGSHFLTPADGFSFVIEDDTRIARIKEACVPGALVTLSINSNVQASGYVDSTDVQNTRESGTTLSIHGRDFLGQVVDTGADPTQTFAPSQPLQQIVEAILAPFGLDAVVDDNDANRSLISGAKYSLKVSHKKGTTLTKAVNHQLRPYPREGCFAFLSRITQRFGLWIWLAADGQTVIVGQPDYTQPTTMRLVRKTSGDGGANNILSGGIKIDFSEQPDIVVAEGFSGGVEWGHAKNRAMAFNPLTAIDDNGLPFDDILKASAKFGDALLTDWPAFPASVRVLKREKLPTGKWPTPRVMYLQDDEAKDIFELERFVRREMSLKLRRAVSAHYTVEGHTQNGKVWCVDTMVDVGDDIADFHGPMYLVGRWLEKSRTGGTVTHLELALPNTLVF